MAFPVDEERIASAEEALGRPLPDGLRERLLRDNGGDVTVVRETEEHGELPDGAELHAVSTDWN